MSDLPAERFAIYEPAVSYTRADYFGPIILEQSKKKKDKFRSVKILWCSVYMFNYQSNTFTSCRQKI